ncbi:winged helix DNA-binding domain-containing protein [Actinoplanes sp. KI2]|uniref:winged helix DNA-binding domain-containing protein n=1 Tax=Actinoplanes sp. KI2 TaxID=2983315 RepID=UPI0021D5E338|nr:winged helix DNA-binding domain-containing protein [Actinoplanes sp. KI2]MCU7728686.1 winged helix DNA-binding domain-containing protein [Actinoplanes sp. KI2]
MDSRTALGLRLSSLLLRGAPSSVEEIVSWFGAMQAQDANSVLWSLGARLPGWSLDDVNAALEKRDVLRTWPMRGTVHLVPSEDAHWMLDLMGSRQLAGAEKRRAQIGLDAQTAERAVDLLGFALAGGRRLTRSECMATLTEGGIDVSGQRGYHLLWYASQRGVSAIAPHVGKEQTFVLLDDWVSAPRRPSREEALGLIALRYFRSHGPATRKDFAGWTGLPMSDCKVGVAVAGDALTVVDVDGVEMIMSAEASGGDASGWLALPGFDEYLLGYKERSLMASADDLAAIIPGGNGVFQSTLVRDGRVVATWKRVLGARGVTVTVLPLAKLPAGAAEKALAPFAAFLGVPLTVKNP